MNFRSQDVALLVCLSAVLVMCLTFPLTLTAAPAPQIASLSAAHGPVGTEVTITGRGFGAVRGSSTVTFNEVAGTPTSWSETRIVVSVPNGATSGAVVVTVNGVRSNGANSAVQP